MNGDTEMVEEGEGQRGSEAQRKRTGDTKETFSISINPQVLQAIDKDVEDGRWDSRSQAISYYVHLGMVGDEQAFELVMQRVLIDALSKADATDCEFISNFLSLMDNPEFRWRLDIQMEEGLGQK